MADPEEPKARLRALRDRLAVEAPRARARPTVPAELVLRLQSALDCSSHLIGAAAALSSPALDEARDDALLEGHLALHDWELFIEQERKQRAQATPLGRINRRQHERHETAVAVRLQRYRVRDGGRGDMTLDSEEVSRPARNISAGGIFVMATKEDLPQLGVGSVVHVTIGFDGTRPFQARAAVAHRDASGLGLRWIHDSDGARREIQRLLDAIRAHAER
jgi:hypothetical protein